MVSSLAPAQLTRTSSTRQCAISIDAVTVASRVAAVLSLSGGVIHAAVIRHHSEFLVVTAGFALMAGAQVIAAAGLYAKPSVRVRSAAVVLHAVIVSTWLVSRSTGLVVVPGAEEPARFGVADIVANGFAIGLVASLVWAARGERHRDVTLTPRVAQAAVAVVAIAAFALTAPAALAPHHHQGHDHPATGEPAPPHDDPTGEGHDHTHAHE